MDLPIFFSPILAAAGDTPKDEADKVDVNLGSALERVDSWVDGFIKLLPNLGIAVLVIVLSFFLASLAKRTANKQFSQRDRGNLGEVLGGFLKMLVIIVGFMLAATVVVPSLKPGDLISGLGVSSVAIGFAFKDILQNWLAGVLILIRQPFEVKDQIEVNGFEGTVERIETRATIIKTYDGQRVVVPNSDIYTNSIIVKTAHEKRRSQYDVGIGYGDNLSEACEVLKKSLDGVANIETDPGPEAFPWDLAASWVTIRVRWWTDSRRADVVAVRGEAIAKMKLALDEAGIDMPYDTSVQLWHDQTDENDGNRSQQREGWPAGDEEVKARRQVEGSENSESFASPEKERKA